jgi:Ser/Thr protein kinase RdoA (MazF antagonist)
LKSTPKQILHNDLCQSNFLVHEDESSELHVSGVIDFSSLIYSHKILELVILCARMNLYSPQPLRNILRVIKAYDGVLRLSPQEKTMLFPLIKVRLAFLCLTSSFLAREKESEPYFARCKNGHLLYLTTISNCCSNQTFLQILEQHLSNEE